jgi:hypothetical protein
MKPEVGGAARDVLAIPSDHLGDDVHSVVGTTMSEDPLERHGHPPEATTQVEDSVGGTQALGLKQLAELTP